MSNGTQVVTTIGGAIIGFVISGFNPMGAVRGKAVAADGSVSVRALRVLPGAALTGSSNPNVRPADARPRRSFNFPKP